MALMRRLLAAGRLRRWPPAFRIVSAQSSPRAPLQARAPASVVSPGPSTGEAPASVVSPGPSTGGAPASVVSPGPSTGEAPASVVSPGPSAGGAPASVVSLGRLQAGPPGSRRQPSPRALCRRGHRAPGLCHLPGPLLGGHRAPGLCHLPGPSTGGATGLPASAVSPGRLQAGPPGSRRQPSPRAVYRRGHRAPGVSRLPGPSTGGATGLPASAISSGPLLGGGGEGHRAPGPRQLPGPSAGGYRAPGLCHLPGPSTGGATRLPTFAVSPDPLLAGPLGPQPRPFPRALYKRGLGSPSSRTQRAARLSGACAPTTRRA
ncbi:decreased expression in renal and prostate cancer protein-like [Pollicipes pollicipes]|uniref:decreased expression in renal and prostate cancer protein-like n=1 Tax=Pollicipes pollicipes TaxID=41117 RepID=UPI0018859DB5|nr:decreased expression in renal and prostate cancer protein-like [Pollicipes pollicipes]